MNKFYSCLRISIAAVIGVLSVFAFAGAFYPVKIFDVQLTSLTQRLLTSPTLTVVILFAFIMGLTLLFGRIYCSILCPFGLLQEFLMSVFKRKNKIEKSFPCKYIIAALVFGVLIGGSAYLIRLIDPYTLFGSVATGMALGVVAVAVITVMVWFRGRFFCANICPVGAILGFISKFSLLKMYFEIDKCVSCGLCASKCPTGSIDFKNKTINNETCIKCFKCMSDCERNGIRYGLKPKPEVSFNASRRRFITSGAVLATMVLAFKGGVEISKNIAAKVKKAILPAGAGTAEEFANRCLNCNLCVQSCPMKIIKKATADYSTVHLDYSESFCDFDCHRCSEVCPSGAIKRISLAEKQKTQIGLSVIDEDKCIKCGLCVMKCPKEAISKENGDFPKVHENICIGCGTCQQGCPVKAIKILPVEKQKIL